MLFRQTSPRHFKERHRRSSNCCVNNSRDYQTFFDNNSAPHPAASPGSNGSSPRHLHAAAGSDHDRGHCLPSLPLPPRRRRRRPCRSSDIQPPASAGSSSRSSSSSSSAGGVIQPASACAAPPPAPADALCSACRCPHVPTPGAVTPAAPGAAPSPGAAAAAAGLPGVKFTCCYYSPGNRFPENEFRRRSVCNAAEARSHIPAAASDSSSGSDCGQGLNSSNGNCNGGNREGAPGNATIS